MQTPKNQAHVFEFDEESVVATHFFLFLQSFSIERSAGPILFIGILQQKWIA